METTIRWKQRFFNFRKALKKLANITEESQKRMLSEFEQQGLIQAFEFTYEIAWLTMKDYLLFQGNQLIAGPRDTIREAFSIGIIKDGENWMDMMKSRNLTVHTYNEEIAESVMKLVLEKYFTLFQALEKTLIQRLND